MSIRPKQSSMSVPANRVPDRVSPAQPLVVSTASLLSSVDERHPAPAMTDAEIIKANNQEYRTVKQPAQVYPNNSKVRKKVLAILAMRADGKTTAEIGKALNLTVRTVYNYMSVAGRHGWLTDPMPKDKLEYEIMHKVVRNLDQMMDSDDPATRQKVTLETAKGTLFKSYDQVAAAPSQSMNVLSIRIELPPGGMPQETNVLSGGTPRFLEGHVSSETE